MTDAADHHRSPRGAAFDFQPTLTGGGVILRPLVVDDWEALFAVARDPLIWAGHPAHDRWQEPVFRTFFAEAIAGGKALAVLDAASGAAIGTSRFDLARAGAGEVEIGWTFLARSHWGGETNRAVKARMIAHALKTPAPAGFDRAIFLVGDTNLRSRRALEKIGAVLTDRVDRAEMAGREVRHVVYAVDRETFAAGPLAGWSAG